MPIDYLSLPPELMWPIVAFAERDELKVVDYRLQLEVRDDKGGVHPCPVPDWVLDELESRGWITIDDAGIPHATTSGMYHFKRWFLAWSPRLCGRELKVK